MFKYVVIDAAGNIVLLIDAGAGRSAGHGHHIRHAVASCEGGSRIDIVGFVSRVDGAIIASYWNPDGTPEKMCGNATRSIPLALQIWLGSERSPKSLSVTTEFCRARVSLNADGTTSVEVPIDAIAVSSFPRTNDTLVDVGTPHIVRAVDELFCEQVNNDGERLSTGTMPVNATFCKVMPAEILARTFERGVGETKSCGTGAIAATIALDRSGAISHLPNPRIVRFASGQVLVVGYSADKASIAVTGRCDLVASGILSLG